MLTKAWRDAVEYELPQHKPVSDECRDLFARIFVADPAKRITGELCLPFLDELMS